MFTGIVRHHGRVEAVTPRAASRTIWVADLPRSWEPRIGDSVAVDGICLTIEELTEDEARLRARFHLGAETLAVTTAGTWEPGRSVHLERALRLGDPVDGHFVQGHVDGVGRVVARTPKGEELTLRIAVPETVRSALVPKGSIAIDGVSLTINAVTPTGEVEVHLIPQTLALTHLGELTLGAPVNVEADPLAKQVAAMVRHHLQEAIR